MNKILQPNTRTSYDDHYYEVWRYCTRDNLVTNMPLFHCANIMVAVFLMEMLCNAHPEDMYHIEITPKPQSKHLANATWMIEINPKFRAEMAGIHEIIEILQKLDSERENE